MNFFSILKDTRLQLPPTAKDVFKLVGLSKQFGDFHAVIDQKYNGSDFNIAEGSLKKTANGVIKALDKLKVISIESVYDYLKKNLTEYLETVDKLIKLHIETEQFLKAVKFEEDFKFCV